jgi:hypothetical protein
MFSYATVRRLRGFGILRQKRCRRCHLGSNIPYERLTLQSNADDLLLRRSRSKVV